MKQEDYNNAKAFEPESEATYYITAAWAKENVTKVPLTYTVGNESVTYANEVTYLNAKLKSGTPYTLFVRIDLRSDTVS